MTMAPKLPPRHEITQEWQMGWPNLPTQDQTFNNWQQALKDQEDC